MPKVIEELLRCSASTAAKSGVGTEQGNNRERGRPTPLAAYAAPRHHPGVRTRAARASARSVCDVCREFDRETPMPSMPTPLSYHPM